MSTQTVQMNSIHELKFPMVTFSPLATSSPRLTKMKKPRCDQSWNSSSGSDSSGNITALLVPDVNVSNIKTSNTDTTGSFHTALEYVNSKVFGTAQPLTLITRNELKSAIFKQKMSEPDRPPLASADFYATVATERILWGRCRTWAGSIPMEREDLAMYVNYACEDWYIKTTVKFCEQELATVIKGHCSFWTHLVPYFLGKGISMKVLKRIHETNLVRRTSGLRLDITEVVQLLFAVIGTDDLQSFEYWFRILDVESTGVLSFESLKEFYEDITKILADEGIAALTFEDVTEEFCDILGTSKWTLKVFKKNKQLAGKVINGFVNAHRFLEEETDERMNTGRLDDENFGEGTRTHWERMLDHRYDNFYTANDSSEVMSTFVKD